MGGPEYSVRPIGYVRSPVKPGDRMPANGVPASVEVEPEFAPALVDLASNSHVWVLAWLANADRDRLTVQREGGERGVFAVRSPARPNPIGLTTSRIAEIRGLVVALERLDFFDGTPVLDLKRYSPGWDSIMSAWTPRDRRPPFGDADERVEWLDQAIAFRGVATPELAVGVRLLHDALHGFGTGPRDPAVTVTVGSVLLGDVVDALQALTGATFGNGRLRVEPGDGVTVEAGGSRRRYRVRKPLPPSADEVMQARLETITALDAPGPG